VSASPHVTTSVDDHVFLVGRPPISEYLGFLETQTLEGQTADRRTLADAWRTANDHVRQLETTESGWADNPTVQSLPAELEPLRDAVLADPIAQRAFALVPIEIGIVELDRLVVFQKSVNVSYVGELRTALGGTPTPEEIFRFALPVDRRYDPPVHVQRNAQNVWTFISQSGDFRPLEPIFIDPAQVEGLSLSGAASGIAGLVVGYGSNFLNAIRVDGRLVLNNGSHRAFTLREAGVTHAPCLIQNVSRRDELEVVGQGELTEEPDRYLTAPRPPVLRDYFDPQLRMLVHVPRKLRQVRVAINFESTEVPAP